MNKLRKIIREEVQKQINELFDQSFDYKKIEGTFNFTPNRKDPSQTVRYSFQSPRGFQYYTSLHYLSEKSKHSNKNYLSINFHTKERSSQMTHEGVPSKIIGTVIKITLEGLEKFPPVDVIQFRAENRNEEDTSRARIFIKALQNEIPKAEVIKFNNERVRTRVRIKLPENYKKTL